MREMRERGAKQKDNVLLAALTLVAVFLQVSSALAFRNVANGSKAPDFTLKSTSGADVSLGASSGKAVVVIFVRQGQEKSARALGALGKIDPTLAEKAAVLAVVINPDDGDAGKWAAQAEAKYPILLDGNGRVYGLYGGVVAPSTGVVGPDGQFVAEVGGYTASYKDEVEALLRRALGAEEKASGAPPEPVAKTEERKVAERHLEQARALLKRKMKEKALISARDAVKADKGWPEAYEVLGTALLDNSDQNAEEAKRNFERALDLAPRSVEAKAGLGRVKSIQGDYPGAVSALEEAARLNPRAERVYYQLGLAHERAKQYEKAVEAYRKALERLMD